MITWHDTICIILETFDISQQELAKLLHVDESAMSKIKNGKQAAHFNSDAVFTAVFDPDNPKSQAQNDTPAFYLRVLKEIISRPKYDSVKKDMEDCWDGTDYQTFAKTLLKRSRNPAQLSASITTHKPVKTTIKPNEAAAITEQESQVESEYSSTLVIDRTPKNECSIQAIFLPHSGDCCYRCIYWEGNRKTFGAYKMPTYGFCVKYNRDNKLSSTIACADYRRREKQNGEW